MWKIFETIAEQLIDKLESLHPPSIDRLSHRLERHRKKARDSYFDAIAEAWYLERQQKLSEHFWPLLGGSIKNQPKSSSDFELKLATQKRACSEHQREMENLQRPTSLILLLRTMLWTLPQRTEAPADLSPQLDEIHESVQKMILNHPMKDPHSINRNIFDETVPPLVERTLKVLEFLESYYRLHPDDSESERFKERVDAAIVLLHSRSSEEVELFDKVFEVLRKV